MWFLGCTVTTIPFKGHVSISFYVCLTFSNSYVGMRICWFKFRDFIFRVSATKASFQENLVFVHWSCKNFWLLQLVHYVVSRDMFNYWYVRFYAILGFYFSNEKQYWRLQPTLTLENEIGSLGIDFHKYSTTWVV